MAAVTDREPEPKIARVLRALIDRSCLSRELEVAPAFDRCSHSMIAALRAEGLAIDTVRLTVPGYAGQPAHIARWSIPDHARPKALQLLEQIGRRHRGRP